MMHAGRDDAIASMPFSNGLGRSVQRGKHRAYPGWTSDAPYPAATALRQMDSAYHVKRMM